MNNFKLIGICILVACLSACRISQKSVTGEWISNYDTLVFDNTKRFVLSGRQKQYEGTWNVNGRSVYMNFKDEAGLAFFGGSDGLTHRRISFTRYKLYRPYHCAFASNRFVVFKKVGHFSTD
jgi:hypothetical protein